MKNKKLTYILAALVVLIGAGAVYYYSRSDSSTETETEITAENSGEDKDNSSKSLPDNPLPKSFVSTITYSNDNDPTQSGQLTFTYVSSTEYAITGTASGEESRIIVSGEYAYIYNQGTWLRSTSDGSVLEVEEFNVTDENYTQFKDSARYIGEEQCSLGTCQVWEGSIDGDSAQISFYKDQIVEVTASTSEGEKIVITYDYEANPVIEVPTEFTDITPGT